MINTLNYCYQNPNLPGHALLQTATYFARQTQQAYKSLGELSVDKEFLEKFQNRIPKLGGPSVSLDLNEISAFQINFAGRSLRPSLAGKVFKCEKKDYVASEGFKWDVTLIEDSNDTSALKICQKKISFLANALLCVVTAPLTGPAAAIGLVLKTSSYYCASKPTFTVLLIKPDEYPSMAKITREWQDFAVETHRNLPELDSDGTVWHDAALISKLVSQCFENPRSTVGRVFSDAYVCRDSRGNEQGFLLLRTDRFEIKIAHMISNPRNIRSLLNDHAFSRVQGTGTALVNFAKKLSVETEKNKVFLEGIVGVESFYEKLGFKKVDVDPFEIEDGEYVMEWAPPHQSQQSVSSHSLKKTA